LNIVLYEMGYFLACFVPVYVTVGHEQRMEENRIPKRASYINLEPTRPRGRPRNRWQDEVREYGRIVGGEE
jgi:hypothetical protein